MMSRVAVIGSRDFNDYDLVIKILDEYEISLIVSGGARGADALAERYADDNFIETLIFPADWKKYGKRAGFIRNKDIVDNSDFVVAFWDGKSRGTKSSIDLATKAGKICYIIKY